MENEAITEDAIRGLKSLEVRLAIDDFGTGYASPSYLKRFPIDTIKIDRSIVEGIDQDPQDEVIAAPAVAAAHGLGASVVAEGIESASQVKRLRGSANRRVAHVSRDAGKAV